MSGVLDSYRAIVRDLAQKAAQDGAEKMKAAALAGIPMSLYLHYKPSTARQHGELLLCTEDEPAPPGFKLATGEALRCNVAYEHFITWVHCRAGNLPILAWES